MCGVRLAMASSKEGSLRTNVKLRQAVQAATNRAGHARRGGNPLFYRLESGGLHGADGLARGGGDAIKEEQGQGHEALQRRFKGSPTAYHDKEYEWMYNIALVTSSSSKMWHEHRLQVVDGRPCPEAEQREDVRISPRVAVVRTRPALPPLRLTGWTCDEASPAEGGDRKEPDRRGRPLGEVHRTSTSGSP